ncbi:alpha-keto acid decarboxylase family protein [Peribacillus sp. SCS-37]|uniref:alpha-keto acid decarboxylase family protein n=1 Tax=Paraperibacillus esterisolvens TaxID=3115296 RepID=UPI003905C54A
MKEQGKKTVGEFLLECLRKESVTEIFGVPGDFNFSLLDTIEEFEGVSFITSRNELNAGYAADGYARLKGMGALITTFGVGEMSACNSIAGSYSEHVPVVHIVGSPETSQQKEGKLLHHSLMDGDFGVFHRVYQNITAYSEVVTPDNAAEVIPKALAAAKNQKKPVYLQIAIDVVTQPLRSERELPSQVEKSEENLSQVVEKAGELLRSASSPVLLIDVKGYRWHLEGQMEELAEKLNIPVVSLMQGKGGFNEQHKLYLGMLGGQFGSSEPAHAVAHADCIVAAGLQRSDMNMAKFTIELDQEKLIDIQPYSIRIGNEEFEKVEAGDFISELLVMDLPKKNGVAEPTFPYDIQSGEADDKLEAAAYYPRIQEMLQPKDVIVVETGTLFYGMSQIRLPEGASYIAQGGWQSIGYSCPAAFGAAMADRDRRVILFTGDGSLQLTVQEISSMLEHGCRLIIFVLNNQGYTVEKYLNIETENQPYNNIPHWDYTKLPAVFGHDAFTVKVRTNRELDEAIVQAETEQEQKLCLIEMIVGDPMDAPQYLKKVNEYMEEQQS